MFVSIKRKTIIIAVLLVACIVTFCVVISVATKSAYSGPKIDKVIVIDAGHGGIDGGMVGVSTGTKESDINLAIAKSLKHFLENKGYTVVMTRSTSDGLYGMASSNRKMKDLEARKKIINDAKPDLIVSIHQNSFPRPQVSGAQVFYAPSSEQGKENAQVMQNTLNVSLGSTKGVKPGDYYILQCSEYQSLLIECGFLSNPEEEKNLISASYQEKVAYALFSGVNSIVFDENTDADTTIGRPC